MNENSSDLNLYFKLYPNNIINCLYTDIIDKNLIVNNNYVNIDTVISVCKKYKC